MLQERLDVLKTEIVEYGILVDEMIRKSTEGLLMKEKPFLYEVIDKDEPNDADIEGAYHVYGFRPENHRKGDKAFDDREES